MKMMNHWVSSRPAVLSMLLSLCHPEPVDWLRIMQAQGAFLLSCVKSWLKSFSAYSSYPLESLSVTHIPFASLEIKII